MSERSVSEVVADLRTHAQHEESLCRLTNQLKTEAAALLERLDAEVMVLVGWVKANCTPEQAASARAASQVATDLLPTCPTCGGRGKIPGNVSCTVDHGGRPCDHFSPPCPDCSDGHVPLARLVALWEAVWAFNAEAATQVSGQWALLDYLRSVKP